MARRQKVHLFTELGALCCAVPPYAWTMNAAHVSCPECRRMLGAGLRIAHVPEQRETEAATVLGRVRGDR